MCGRYRAAFTLIELLVVIAIIALLLSILVPAMSDARAQARDVKCRTQLREYGRAFSFYLGEHRDVFPASDYGPVGTQITEPTWFALMEKYFFTSAEPDQSGMSGHGYRVKLRVCPDLPRIRENNGLTMEWDNTWRTFGYGYNRFWLGWNLFLGHPDNPPPLTMPKSFRTVWWRKLVTVRNTSECLMLADSVIRLIPQVDSVPAVGHYLGWREMVGSGSGIGAGIDTRHRAKDSDNPSVEASYGGSTVYYRNGRGNICWVDGHLSSRTSKQINHPADWRRYWDPEQKQGAW